MAKRHRIPPKQSQRQFTRGARVHGKNHLAPMRGGIRL
ncbi:MAG: hypothetical protein [Microvirus sp.]|nr:MAG: hypothetical protein [Microvirus sp.]